MTFFTQPPLVYTSGHQPQCSLIWLHGLGADGHDFENLPQALAPIGLPITRFIFPHAPLRPVSLNGGYPMPAWFDLFGTSADDPQDVHGIKVAAAAIHALVRAEENHGIPSHRVVIGGFSQGGALALHTGLTGPDPVAAVIGLSTYLPLATEFPHAFHLSRQTPLFMAHGVEDTVVPYAFGERSRDLIRTAGGEPVFRSYTMGHTVNEEELRDMGQFLYHVLRT